MTLVELREKVRADVSSALGSKVGVQTHGGRFDLEELRRWALKAPCVLVAILGLPRLELQGGDWCADLRWGAFMLTKDAPGRPRDAAALDLLQAVLAAVRPEEGWGDPDGQAVREVAAENLYSGKFDAEGVALWLVTWRQRHDLAVLDLTTLADFLTYHVLYDVGGVDTPKPEDTVSLPPSGV